MCKAIAMELDLSGPAISKLVTNRRAQLEPFNHVISLGSNCYTAWLIAALGLRRASYPFDWIFSTPDMVIDMIEDRFVHFLDPTCHARAPEDLYSTEHGGRTQHLGYLRRFGVNNVFNHHDVLTSDGLAYFSRCAARFHAVTSSSRKTLLLMVNTAGAIVPESFERLCHAINRCGDRNTLMCINVGCAGDSFNMGMSEPFQYGRHRLRTYKSTSEMDGVRFINPLDDIVLRCAIMQYNFQLDGSNKMQQDT